MVLAPVAAQLAQRKRVVIVSDEGLQYIPFAALPAPGGSGAFVPMIEQHEVVMLPSATVVAARRSRPSPKVTDSRSVAVLADPVFESSDPRFRGEPQRAANASPERPADWQPETSVVLRTAGIGPAGALNVSRLIATRREAESITRLAPPGTVLTALDFRANRSTALSQELARYPIVHFATHGVVNNDAPELSGVMLSMFDEHGRPQDGFLRLRDIYGLKLPAQLVVLSACNTALGRPIRGEGLDGMVRGFLHAGARRVVASYWKVDDAATAALMDRFYAEMLRNGRSPSAAMQAAQRSMLQTSRWRSPFYWAGFAVYGDWQ
jgi:CHAT domain-containing protein